MAKTEYRVLAPKKKKKKNSHCFLPGTLLNLSEWNPPFTSSFELKSQETLNVSLSLRVHSLSMDNSIGSRLEIDPQFSHYSPSPLTEHHFYPRQCNSLITGLLASTFVCSNPSSKTRVYVLFERIDHMSTLCLRPTPVPHHSQGKIRTSYHD